MKISNLVETLIDLIESLDPVFIEVEEHRFKNLFDKDAKSIFFGLENGDKKLGFDVFISREIVDIKIFDSEASKSYYREFLEEEFDKIPEFFNLIKNKLVD